MQPQAGGGAPNRPREPLTTPSRPSSPGAAGFAAVSTGPCSPRRAEEHAAHAHQDRRLRCPAERSPGPTAGHLHVQQLLLGPRPRAVIRRTAVKLLFGGGEVHPRLLLLRVVVRELPTLPIGSRMHGGVLDRVREWALVWEGKVEPLGEEAAMQRHLAAALSCSAVAVGACTRLSISLMRGSHSFKQQS